jgi:hypothetical protein
MKTIGLCVEWFQELFEDSYSVLTFGSDFLVYFENILSRHNTVDGRHPPKEIRMGMAKALLALADKDLLDEEESTNILIGDQPGLSENDKKVIKIVARQITKFSSLVSMANGNKILTNWEKTATSSKEDSPYIQQNAVLGEILIWFAVDEYYKDVINNIKSSIANWTSITPEHGELDDDSLPLDEQIDKFLKGIENKKSPEASFEQLLDKRNYKQLLDLPFYERDFFNSSGITNVIYRKDGNDISQNFNMQTSNAVFTPGIDCTLVGTQTIIREVRFNAGGNTYTLDRITWNNKFPPGSSFIIS